MSDKPSNEANLPEVSNQAIGRRLFLQSLGKWSGAAIAAVVAGNWLAPQAEAAGWVNRRCGGGGAWVNHRYGGGTGAWVNRHYGGGGAWVNRW
jgi:hypothetical protein